MQGGNYPPFPIPVSHAHPLSPIVMADGLRNFVVSSILGFTVMIVLNPFFPVGGPILGGIVSGYFGEPGIWNGMKGGIVSAVLASLLVSVLLIAGGAAFLGVLGALIGAGIGMVVLVILLYFSILGIVGGAIGGALKERFG